MNYHETVFISMTCTVCVFFKLYITNTIAGAKNTAANLRSAEDFDKLPFKKNDNESDPKVKEQQFRWSRIVQNDLENLPIGLIIFWAATISSAKGSDVVPISFITFTVARTLYSIFYGIGLQPYRTMVYLIALFSMIVGGITGIINAADRI